MKSSPGLTQQAIGISGCQRLWICSFSVAGWLRSTLISVSVMTKLLGPLRGLGATAPGYGASLQRRRKTANTSDDVCPAPVMARIFSTFYQPRKSGQRMENTPAAKREIRATEGEPSHRQVTADRRFVDLVADLLDDELALLDHQEAVGDFHGERQHLFGDHDGQVTQIANLLQGAGDVLDDRRLDALGRLIQI